jgi:hypothetical protein
LHCNIFEKYALVSKRNNNNSNNNNKEINGIGIGMEWNVRMSYLSMKFPG